jgi:predicted nucleic acid-binding protein
MVLIDSSAWVAGLYGRAPFAAWIPDLAEREQVLGHAFVYGELAMGDVRGGRHALLRIYEDLPYAITMPHQEVVALVRARGLQGKGIGWVDVHLLASAFASGARLLTADKALRAVAETLGILYREGLADS